MIPLVMEETEKAMLGVLMTAPPLRGAAVARYPGQLESFFSYQEARDLLHVIMSTKGLALPSSINPLVPHLVDSAHWSPQRIYDGTSYDAVDRFWKDLEQLRQFAKKRRLIAGLKPMLDRIPQVEDIDLYAAKINDFITKVNADTGHFHDPTAQAVAAEFQARKRDGKTGRWVSTGIPRLDLALEGGLRVEPGELVSIAAFQKNRKTTLAANIMCSWHLNGEPGATVWVCNEESIDSVQAFCGLCAMMATRLAYQRGLQFEWNGRTLTRSFSAQDILQRKFDGEYGKAVDEAYEMVRGWNLRFYFAGMDDGDAMNFESIMARVRADIEFNNAKRVVVDNLQGWRRSDENDYEVMNRVVPSVAALVGNYHALVLAISQFSRQGKVLGGGGLEGRANLIMATEYDGADRPDVMTVKREYTRDRGYFKIDDLRIEPRSGLIIDDLAR